MSESTTVHLERCLKRLNERDGTARREILEFAERRLKVLAGRMFLRFPQLYAREQADDLFQEAMLRLWQSLERVHPTTVTGFMGLAAEHVRRALLDLIRKHFGRDPKSDPNRPRRRPKNPIPCSNISELDRTEDTRNAPDEMASWSDFHAAADRLPEPHRTAFDLLYYHELPQLEAAELMNVSLREIQRLWRGARMKLGTMMHGSWPEL
jgi:RNA polymerase sigma factor (sigma-70 family)